LRGEELGRRRRMGRQLKGTAVLITGASAGIGKAAALAFAKEGSRLLLAARRRDRLEEVAAAVRALGGEAVVAETDVADRRQVQSAVDMAVAAFGRLDILVNNAGIGYFGLLEDTPIEAVEALWAVNVMGTIYATQAVIPLMRKQGGGHIINIASVVGLTGNPGQANYVSAKAGMIGFTKSLAMEVGSRGITVNSVAPGFIDTDMTRQLPEDRKQHLLGQIPLGRLGTPAEVAAVVVFLASREAGYITGETININGGIYMA